MVEKAYVFVGKTLQKKPSGSGRKHALLGGLTLPERLAYQMAKAGLSRVVFLGAESKEEILSRKPGPSIEMAFAPAASVGDAISSAKEADAPVMLVRADRIYGNDLIAEAAKLEPKGDGALEAAAGGGNEAAAGEGDEDGRVGIMVASPEFLADQTVGKDAGSSDEGLVDVYVRLRDGGRKKGAVETARLASSFWHRVEKPADLRPARDALFQSLGKPIDGFISRHFNRPVSQAVSKRICNLPFTPNQISAVVFLIGLAAAGVTLLMDWVWVAVGAVLFHAASVFDGVDGEIARVKFQATKFGALLDSILDHIVMVAWILAIGYVIYWRGGSFFYPILGYVVFFCTAVGSAMVNYEQVVKTRSGQPMEVEWDFEKEEHKDKLISKVINSIRFFVSRDADCVVLGLFAIFNFLEPIPIIGATVAIVYFTVVLGHQIRKLFAGSAESSAADGSE